jgi:hypothetical protein
MYYIARRGDMMIFLCLVILHTTIKRGEVLVKNATFHKLPLSRVPFLNSATLNAHKLMIAQ